MNIPVLMGKKWLLPAVVVAVLVIGAVAMRGSGHRGTDIDVDGEDKVNVKTDEGEWSAGRGVPGNWPDDVPVYAGASVQQSASSNPATGESGSYLALQSSDSASAVAQYYQQELPKKGWSVTGTAQVNGGTYLTAEKSGRQLSIAISPAESGSVVIIGVVDRE